MNKIILLFISLFFCCQFASAQFSIGARVGVSTSDISSKDLNILSENGTENLRLALADAKYGIHAGLIFQFKGIRWSIQPEVHFNSNKVDFFFML